MKYYTLKPNQGESLHVILGSSDMDTYAAFEALYILALQGGITEIDRYSNSLPDKFINLWNTMSLAQAEIINFTTL
jgi:hypothetical protein